MIEAVVIISGRRVARNICGETKQLVCCATVIREIGEVVETETRDDQVKGALGNGIAIASGQSRTR
jgi:hypothetical protein